MTAGGSDGRRRGLALLAVIAALFGLQVDMTARTWTRPFLDGALHYDFDNADFSRRARNGIQLGGPRTQVGLTEVHHVAWGVPTGEPKFYTHHPFLMKAGFQLFVRVFGSAEWVSRVFALLVAATAVAGVLVGLYLASGSLLAAGLGTLVLVKVPVFATYQACIKYELDGMALGAWLFVAVALTLRTPTRGKILAVGLLAFLSALAHWTAVLFAGALVTWLGGERLFLRRQEAGAPALAAGAGLGAGVCAVLAVFAWLAGGWEPFLQDLGAAARMRTDVTTLTRDAWFERQALYVGMNFGALLPWLAGALGLGWIALGWRRRSASSRSGPSRRLGAAFVGCTLATALAWQFGFPQGSFVHVYWQLWFVLPVAGLVTASVTAFGSRGWKLGASLASVALAAHLHLVSRDAYAGLLRLQRGTVEDVAFLVSQREDRFTRFVFVPIHDVPLNLWFTGPIFPYYTDREVVTLASAGPVAQGDRLLVLRHEGQPELVARLGDYLGARLGAERCGPRFCAYDVLP